MPDMTDLKKMNIAELESLCEELRKKIISTVMKNGGHLSSNLGAIELSVALHYVFDFPTDKLIFDVGHQCYAHKILSGRGDKFDTIRCRGGLSGFPKTEESEYDCYNTGHAGTSISAALGMAKARDIKGDNFNVICMIGDGSFNNGLVYEAFNSVRTLESRILIILNDNGMSISPTVGSMHEYLEKLSKDYAHQTKAQRHADIFEKFGLLYDGVYDGNDVGAMVEKLEEVREKLKTQSVILHVLTKKGKGYAFCEENPQQTHGISGEEETAGRSYSNAFGKALEKIAEMNNEIVAVTAAMTPSLGLSHFFEKFPKRAIDVGICEEHAVILAAALASQGLKPYYAVYSTFLQRSIDEIMIDVCSQNLPVTFCIDRAGVSGEDGETHQGVFDISFLSMIPNIRIAVPKDINELTAMVEASAHFNAPLAIRYPKECKTLFKSENPENVLTEWEYLEKGNCKIAILACGERTLRLAYKVNEKLLTHGLTATVINARVVKPLDEKLLNSLDERLIVTLEDNQLIGGFGSLIACYFADRREKIVKCFGYGDNFIPHGTVEELMDEFGLSAETIADYIVKNADR